MRFVINTLVIISVFIKKRSFLAKCKIALPVIEHFSSSTSGDWGIGRAKNIEA